MRKYQIKQIKNHIKGLHDVQHEIRHCMEEKSYQAADELVIACQELAIQIGNFIEQTEYEGHVTVSHLETYCEAVFLVHEALQSGHDVDSDQLFQKLYDALTAVENSISNDIRIRREAVFLPYKASMWDSLESVWKEAHADPDCDDYVIPIPYFDRNSDGTVKEMHYEGEMLPDYVPVTKYDQFDFGAHKPDMMFIHNPYDGANYVTSVHPFFYSDNLKKYTDCLVYIPYFASAGGMSEGQAMCPAYLNVDYIVIQSEKYRKFYDESIPDEKFLAFGSPKFDSVIQKCGNPPEPLTEWKEQMTKADGTRKRVYFYNTSIGGMLGDTSAFLKKMQYVFDTFKGRDDVCLLWRPHPLLESTFDSMRATYKPVYDALKKEFIGEKIGIYDITPSIENTIALSDVYIGDEGTSVTSLFGVAGKPLFILNNYIHTLPEKDDWRGEIINPVFDMFGDDRFFVTSNNKLWYSEHNDYHYKFYMDLETGYAGGNYYMKALQKGDKIYVIPQNAQHLLIIKDKKIIQKIEFQDQISQAGAFYTYWHTGKYIFLIPFRYPNLIRYDINSGEICYMKGVADFAARNINGEWCFGAVAQYKDELVIASPEENSFLFIQMDSLQVRIVSSQTESNVGTQLIVPDGNTLWLLPLNGMTLASWNPETGEVYEYHDRPEAFKVIKFPLEMEVAERPFGNIVVSRKSGKENIVISPYWGNMYLTLDPVTGKMSKWDNPVGDEIRGRNGYYFATCMGSFVLDYTLLGSNHQHMWYAPERKLYDIDIETKQCKEIDIEFDYRELENAQAGFMEESEWIQYCCRESSFHTLKDLLDNHITGNRFDKDRQLKAFAKVNASTEGNCGTLVYRYLCTKEE